MYLQPERIDQLFLEFMGAHEKLCRYLDVPFQHSDREVLRRMGRWGDGGLYLELLDRARRVMPDVSLRSTFIVGFPGETEEQFENLVDFVETARFDYAGGFIYSPEEGTKASGLRPGVNGSVARRRLNSLNDLVWQTSERERGRLIGTELEVMIDALEGDELAEGADAVGRTRGQAPEVDGVTYLEGPLPPGVLVGDVVKVRINAVAGCDLIGDICAA
jgi:ribosomal protein S12 methylthiotransferase